MILNRLKRVFVKARIPLILMLPALFCLAMENGHRIRAVSVLRATRHTFNEIAMQSRTRASKRLAKAIRASHGP